MPEYKTVCPSCNKSLTLVYDPGYPDTREEPGMPADWYVDGSAHDLCDFTKEQEEELKTNATNSEEYRAYERAESMV